MLEWCYDEKNGTLSVLMSYVLKCRLMRPKHCLEAFRSMMEYDLRKMKGSTFWNPIWSRETIWGYTIQTIWIASMLNVIFKMLWDVILHFLKASFEPHHKNRGSLQWKVPMFAMKSSDVIIIKCGTFSDTFKTPWKHRQINVSFMCGYKIETREKTHWCRMWY